MRFFLGKGGGSRIAREAVPSAFALPILFELFHATTRWLEIDSRLAQWLFYVVVLCLLLPPILRPVVALNRSERLRDAAERTRVQDEVGFRGLIESAGETIISADSGGRIDYVNRPDSSCSATPPTSSPMSRSRCSCPSAFARCTNAASRASSPRVRRRSSAAPSSWSG